LLAALAQRHIGFKIMSSKPAVPMEASNKEAKLQSQLPHNGCCTRICRSRIHGVGVFAIRKIKKGTSIFPDDDQEIEWIKSEDIENLPAELRKLYDHFCIIKDNGKTYGCPRSFNHLTVSWYLNEPRHPQKPNVECRDGYMFYALRDIAIDEELTVDYDTFSERPRRR
jgi:SET domain-containing protein